MEEMKMQNKYCQNCRINTKQVFVESIWRCEECFNTHSEFLPHPESLLHEIALAGSQIIQLNEEIKRLMDEVKESNQIIRSAYSIAERDGNETNWEAWRKQLEIALERQHAMMYGKD
jgi:ribosomal protein L37AE/L43A